jgi:hypothetical protein
MTEGPGVKGAPRPFTEVELAAIEAYLPELRRSAAGQRILYWSLAIGFVVGLAAHGGGYLLRSSTTEPLALVADLLYALGWALWTVSSWSCSSRSFPRQTASNHAGARCLRGSAARQGPSRKRPGVGGRRSADGQVARGCGPG